MEGFTPFMFKAILLASSQLLFDKLITFHRLI